MKRKPGRPPLSKDEKILRVFRELNETEKKVRILEKDYQSVRWPSLKAQIAYQINAVKYKRDTLREKLNQLKKGAD